MSEAATQAAIEEAVRRSYGRLIAYLAARAGDVAGAEDALGDALAAALRHWPQEGVPEKPEAWLLRVAGHRLIDAARRRQVRREAEPQLIRMAEATLQAQEVAARDEGFPDDRLKLLFVCAHPALDPAARTPLMLQTVLGIDAGRIASAFLVSPAAMAQRLVRAKNKIRDAGIPFRVPEPPEWSERVDAVLDAIYSAYTAGWESPAEGVGALAAEALALGRTLVTLMPEEPEARGLLALMLHCEARRPARLSAEGRFVPLDRQDSSRWSKTLSEEAEEQLRLASGQRRLGRYQLEAAIQSIHAARAISGIIDWAEILLLYEGLVRIAPGIGAQVGRAVALAQNGRVAEGLAALDELPVARVAAYQPYWAARAHLLENLARLDEAIHALQRAAALTDEAALREHLLEKAAELSSSTSPLS